MIMIMLMTMIIIMIRNGLTARMTRTIMMRMKTRD